MNKVTDQVLVLLNLMSWIKSHRVQSLNQMTQTALIMLNMTCSFNLSILRISLERGQFLKIKVNHHLPCAQCIFKIQINHNKGTLMNNSQHIKTRFNSLPQMVNLKKKINSSYKTIRIKIEPNKIRIREINQIVNLKMIVLKQIIYVTVSLQS